MPAALYKRLGETLQHAPLQPSASEAQGLFAGLLCGVAPEPEATWLQELFGDASPSAEDRRLLREVAQHTLDELRDGAFRFKPLFLGESDSLRVRAEALCDWVQGFLYGLALGGMDQATLSDIAREALNALTEITRLDLHHLETGEESEQALMELEEFLRVTVMLFFAEGGQS